MAESTIITKIKAYYPYQSKKKKQISDYIQENISSCCFLSLHKLSAAIGVTEVTMLNYCRSLGYDSFSDFRDAMREYLVYWRHPNERIWNIGESGKEKGIASSIIDAEKDMISSLAAANPGERIAEAASLIISKKRIFIAAHGISSVSADYCMRRLVSIGKDASILTAMDYHLMASQISQFDPEDCLLIALAVSPHGDSTVRAVKLCHEENIGIISITDNPLSEIASDSTIALIGNASIKGATNSIISTIAMIDVLAISASARSRNSAPEAEERFRRMLEFSAEKS